MARLLADVGWRLGRMAMLPVVLLLLWQTAARHEWLNPVFFPAPADVLSTAARMWDAGVLTEASRITVGRAITGWLIATVVGVTVAVAITRSQVLNRSLTPVVEFMRAIPAAAIVPAAVLVLGFGAFMEVSVVAFAAVWPVLLNAVLGIRSTDPILVDVARSMHLGRAKQVTSIQLPSALPHITLGMRVSLSIALIVAVVAEMVASAGGLGDVIIQASRRFRSAEVYAVVIVLGVVGLVANNALQYGERRLLGRRR